MVYNRFENEEDMPPRKVGDNDFAPMDPDTPSDLPEKYESEAPF